MSHYRNDSSLSAVNWEEKTKEYLTVANSRFKVPCLMWCDLMSLSLHGNALMAKTQQYLFLFSFSEEVLLEVEIENMSSFRIRKCHWRRFEAKQVSQSVSRTSAANLTYWVFTALTAVTSFNIFSLISSSPLVFSFPSSSDKAEIPPRKTIKTTEDVPVHSVGNGMWDQFALFFWLIIPET